MFILKREALPIGLLIGAAVLALALSLAVPKAGAVTVDDLMAQIKALQAQLVTLQGSSAPAATACTFTRSLYVGVRGDDVKCLQGVLNVSPKSGFYGPLTKAAVAKWQAANNVSPAAGYFGAISRAKYVAMAGGVVVTPPGVTPPGVTPPAAAGGLSVALKSDTPAARTMVAGAAMMPFGRWSFTAGSGDVTVSGLKFTRGGISSDSELGNAYLYNADTGDYLFQYSGLGSAVLSFANAGGLFTVKAGATKNVELRLDISSGASNNHTMSWALNAATDLTSNATGVSGTFPSSSNAMTFVTVSNPSIATLTSASVTTGSSVNAGTTGYLAGSFTLQSANSAVLIDRIVLVQNGSLISSSDVTNVKLVTTGGTQLGSTLANMKSDGTGTFVLSPAYEVPSGQTIQVNVYADVVAGVNRTLKFNVLNLRDLQARDKTYNVGVNMSASVAMTQSTVQAGTLTVTIDPSSPNGNVAKGQTNLTLAKFKVTSYGEQVKVLFVPFKVVMTGGGVNFQSNVNNVYLVDDAGNQIGTTINGTSVSSSTGTSGTWSDGDTTAATFGTSSSNINYLIPANVTRVWSLKADIKSGTGASDIAGSLQAGSSNYQGQVSLSSGSSTAVTGNTLTIASNPFQGTLNSAMGATNLVKSQANARIASFVLSASSAEGINISTITVTSSSTFPFANLYAKVNGVQFGTLTGSVAVSTSYTFAGSSSVIIASGGNATVDIYTDVLSSAANVGSSYYVQLTGASATGAVTATTQTLKDNVGSGTAISSTNAINSQGLTINTTGGTITVDNDSSSPAAYQAVMGKTGQSLGIWKFTGATTEDVKINTIAIKDKVGTAGNKASFQNLQWYKGGVAVGPVMVSGTASGSAGSETGYLYTANFTSPVVVPQLGGASLELRGDVASKVSGGATSNSTHIFSFNPQGAYINAVGAGTSLTAVVNDTASTANALATTTAAAAVTYLNGVANTASDVNAITIARTKLTVISDPTGIALTSHSASANDVMAVFVFTADAGYDVTISTVTLKLAGATLATTSVQLIDADTGSAWGSSGTSIYGIGAGGASNNVTGASSSIAFFPAYTLSGGSTKKVKVQASTSGNTGGLGNYTATTGSTNGTSAQWSIANDTSGSAGSVIYNALCWGDNDTTCAGSAGSFNLEAKFLPIYGPSIRY